MDAKLLERYASGLGISLDADKAELLCRYGEAVMKKNKQINLTATAEEGDFLIKHLLDSLTVAVSEDIAGNVADVGTGGGFPGVVIKAYRPECRVTLIDSTGKKLTAVKGMCDALGIDVDIVHGRAEELSRGDLRESFDTVTARAVADLPRLLEYCLPLVKAGGSFIAMKGPDADEEIGNSAAALSALGGKIMSAKKLALPDGSGRTIIAVSKVVPTSEKYPRQQKRIAQNPIT